MVATLDNFVNEMEKFSGSLWSQIELAEKSRDLLVKNVQNLDSLLDVLDIQTHTCAHAAIMRAKHSVPITGDFEVLFLQTQHFFYNCNGEHVREIPQIFCQIAHDFTTKLITQGMAIRGLAILVHALRKFQMDPRQLTSIHADVCQLALAAKCFSPVLPVLNDDIFDINDERGRFSAKDYLLYYYYGGMVYLAMKNLDRSLYFFELCLMIPALVTSKIMIEAYKKYILVSFLHSGKLLNLPKTVSTQIAQRTIRSHCGHYVELANAFASNSPTELQRAVEKHQEVFIMDKNFGLVKQVVERQVKTRIQRLTKTFMTLSLADVASRVSLGSPQEAEKYLMQMIECREIYACISEKDGMVRFLDSEEKYNSAGMLLQLQHKMDECISLERLLLRMNDQVVTSVPYLKRIVEMEKKAGGPSSSSTHTGPRA